VSGRSVVKRGLERAALALAKKAVLRVVKAKMYLYVGGAVVAGLLGLFILIIITGAGAQAASDNGATAVCTRTTATDVPPTDLMAFYHDAADQYHLGELGWAMLASINKEESDFGRSTLPGVHSAANDHGAAGPMQMGIGGASGTAWYEYGVDADGDGDKDVYDPDDAIHGAANKLSHQGAPGDWHKALHSYNPDEGYITRVTARAQGYLGGCESWTYAPPMAGGVVATLDPTTGEATPPAGAPEAVTKIIEAANLIANKPYLRGGGHGGGGPGSWPIGDAYDCSGLVSFALHGAGLLDTPLTSSGFAQWGVADDGQPGHWVTIYATSLPDGDPAAHVFMIVAGLRLDTGGGDRHGTAWRPAALAKARKFAGFIVRHPPGL
jgi:hypothetical protein